MNKHTLDVMHSMEMHTQSDIPNWNLLPTTSNNIFFFFSMFSIIINYLLRYVVFKLNCASRSFLFSGLVVPGQNSFCSLSYFVQGRYSLNFIYSSKIFYWRRNLTFATLCIFNIHM